MHLTTRIIALLLVALLTAAQQPVQGSSPRSLAPGETLTFKQLKIAVLSASVDSSAGGSSGVARIRLEEGGATQEVTVQERVSLNWHGYHVAIAAVHRAVGVGGVRVDLDVARVADLPQCKGKPIGEDQPWPCH